jgi:hypothetical protein
MSTLWKRPPNFKIANRWIGKYTSQSRTRRKQLLGSIELVLGKRSTQRKEADVDGVINDYQAFGPPPVVPSIAPGTQPRRRHDRKGCDTYWASNPSDLVIPSLS